ncbi:MAG: amidohydrolase family protein [Planctomycetaceae bacterium]|nr:amidohydrolase family protein [Planctomycetaceae bacterium]
MNADGQQAANRVIRCAWLLRPGQPPLPNRRLTIEAGLLTDISVVPADERHLIAPVAVIPALVNAHTHLEFSRLERPLEPSAPFPDWIRAVIGYRRQHPTETDICTAVASGVQQSDRSGVRLIGEICASDSAAVELQRAIGETGGRAVCFREFIGFRSEDIPQRVAELDALVASHVAHPVRMALSPHAPYSVHPRLFEAVVSRARAQGGPIAMHLAETRDELELLQHRSGRFREFLDGLGLWDRAALGEYRSILPYLEALATCHRALAVHANYLTDDEIQFLADHPHVAVVYCPRTHRWFGHDAHPAEKLRQAGATVVLGTDSRASNPDLSIWRELQLATRLSADALWQRLPEVTTTAAAALGYDPADFDLQTGRPAAMLQVSCSCNTEAAVGEFLVSDKCQVMV